MCQQAACIGEQGREEAGRTRVRMRAMTCFDAVPLGGSASKTGSSSSPALPFMDSRIFTCELAPQVMCTGVHTPACKRGTLRDKRESILDEPRLLTRNPFRW